MEIIKKITENSGAPLALSIGNFDGMHEGHNLLINKVIEICEKHNCSPAIMTFNPMPQEFFRQNNFFKIMSDEDKLAHLENMGIKKCYLVPFTQAFSEIDADTFINQILLKSLRVEHLIVGEDFRFGYERKGDLNYLMENYSDLIRISSVKTIKKIDSKIGSSGIRKLIIDGRFDEANKFLLEPFNISGTVEHGDKVGRDLGYPTANIKICNSYPINGIFYVKAYFKNNEFNGIASIGTKPTFSGDKPLLEVYIFDFNKDIYGENLKVRFIKKIRNQIKFDNKEQLVKQMNDDYKRVKEIINN